MKVLERPQVMPKYRPQNVAPVLPSAPPTSCTWPLPEENRALLNWLSTRIEPDGSISESHTPEGQAILRLAKVAYFTGLALRPGVYLPRPRVLRGGVALTEEEEAELDADAEAEEEGQ